MIRVLVGDSNDIIRRGLREILNEQTGMQVLAEASNQAELLEKVCTEKPDVVVLEATMPGRQALDILKQLRTDYRQLPIVFLGARPSDIHIAQRAIRAGASAFLSRNSPPKEIIHAIRKSLQGGRYISGDMAQKLAFEALDEGSDVTPDLLSDRELQVMCMIAAGKTTKEIAGDLNISYNTVSTYRQRILEKMRMKHNADMIRYCIENKLIETG